MPVKYSPAAAAAAGAATALVPPNILLASLDYGDAAWLKAKLSVQANAAAAPGGAHTADQLIEDTTSGNHELKQTFTKPAGATTLFASVAAKAAGRTQAYLNLDDNSSTNRAFIRVDLTTGVNQSATVAGTVRIPTIATTRSDRSRPPVPDDRDQCGAGVVAPLDVDGDVSLRWFGQARRRPSR